MNNKNAKTRIIEGRKAFLCDSKNKKGQALVIGLLIIIAITVFSIAFFIIGNLYDNITTSITDSNILDAESQQVLDTGNNQYNDIGEGIFITLYSLLALIIIAMSWFSSSNPMLLVITILLIIISLVGSLFLANIWSDSIESIPDVAINYPVTNSVMNNLFMVTLGIALLSGFIIFMRNY